MATRNIHQPIEVGQKFHRWTVIGDAVSDANNLKNWLCRCECGTERRVRHYLLTAGKSKSCGCFQREDLGSRKLKHGYSAGGIIRPEYSAWESMIARCTKPKVRMYPHYGGRGIRVCQRWMESFENFIADMGNRPSDKHSLDRIKNELGYEPGNCRWAIPEVQQNNRRNTVFIAYNGQRLPLAEVVRKHSIIDLETVRCRVIRQGWSLERAMSTPKLK
jgi:hypothetical protein